VTPSPALVKAALINSAVDMDNADGTDSVPNFDEGWGRVDLTQIIGSTRRYEFVDQTELLSTAQIYEKSIVLGSSAQPLKITLTYTDVPGLPAAIPALVNDLDLEVIAPDGKLYRGNQFIDGESIDGGDVGDNINNVEAVHLVEPLPGEYLVRVRARNVVEDIHQAASAQPQQDFALVVSGDLPASGTGVLFFDRKAYSVPGLVQLKLIDLNLAGQSSVSVVLKSSTESNGEVIALRPLGSSGVFTGSVATVSGPAIADGRLQIRQGDTIEATYQDLAPAGTRTATALADLLPPVIANISVTNRFGRESITFQTDEPASSVVFYGTNNLNLSFAITNRALSTDHEVALDNLTAGVTYHFFVVSADEAGNSATNTNGGANYDFVAKPAAMVLLVDAYVPDDPTLGTPPIPLTNYTDAIDQTQISYEVWDLTQPSSPSPGTNDLRPFRVVIWRLNDSLFRGGTSLSSTQQKALESYVNGGGSLFISSMELLTDLGDVSFRTNVLHVRAFAEDAGVDGVLGQENDPITGGMDLALDYSAYDSDLLQLIDQSPDVADTLTITTNATPIFFDILSSHVAGLRYPRTGQDSPGRVVFLSFPFDAVSGSDEAPNNRAVLMRNILSFLAPGVNGLGAVLLDRTAYTIPDRVTVEVADSDLPSGGQTSVKIFSNTETNGTLLILGETVHPGIWRGSFTLVSTNNPSFSGQLRARGGDAVWVEYFDASANRTIRASADVDVSKPAITAIDVVPEYQEATVTWETSEPTDALVQFGESTFLGRTAYGSDLATDHELTLVGLQPDRLYYYQVVSQDDAGNPTVDDNQGRLYTFRTLKPLSPPWFDSLDGLNNNSQTNWSVVESELSNVNWQLGVPQNGLETTAHSPPNAWGSNITGDSIDTADTMLVTPAIELAGGNLATLRFWQSYDFTSRSEFDIYEYGQVYISTNSSGGWTLLEEFGDASASWEEAEIDLTPYLGNVVQFGWYYGLFSLEGNPRPGWLIDDISVSVTNIMPGTIQISNNIAQANFSLSGPISRNGQGSGVVITNAPSGEYVLTFNDVPYYTTPPAQTNVLEANQTLLFQGNYTIVDANSNGISDAWEQAFFGAVSPQRTQTTDTDGDGLSDYAEFIAGSNPTNATSSVTLSLPAQQSSGLVQLNWPSTLGHAYRLELSTNAIDWTPLTGWLRATRTNTFQTLPRLTNGPLHLFRLQVGP
ncbi:MAG: choice-of-anchor J domain-containing protein, partial [Verrucomicrobiota bacterium]